MKVTYSSNNSGGSWWLTDEHWQKLERAGWEVLWGSAYYCHSRYSMSDAHRPADHVECWDGVTPEGQPYYNPCHGHRAYRSYEEALAGAPRFLGALAREACKDFPSLAEGIREWESITGLSADDNGCGCCGPPHSFSADGEYASGDDIVSVLYPSAPTSLREAAKRLAREGDA